MKRKKDQQLSGNNYHLKNFCHQNRDNYVLLDDEAKINK